MKQRIRQYILDIFGQKVLDEVLSGKRKVFLNDHELTIDAHFRDKRVTETSKVTFRPPALSLSEKATTDKKIKEKTTTQVNVKLEKEYEKVLEKKGLNPKDVVPSKEMTGLFKKYAGIKEEEPEAVKKGIEAHKKIAKLFPVEVPAKTYVLKDYLSTEQIVSIRAGKSNVFVDGIAKSSSDLETLKIEPAPDDAKPTLNGNKIDIKVLPRFTGG